MAAEIIIAGVTGLLQAIELWVTVRDRHAANAAFKRAYPEIATNRSLQQEARNLESLVPERVLEAMKDKVERCWTRYQEVLDDDDGYLPGEVDSATNAVKQCICRELRRIRELNGDLPPGKLLLWWNKYCA